MLTTRQLFLRHQAQTTDFPLSLEMEYAEGVYIFDSSGKKYLDLISGIGVSNVGHRHPRVLAAIHEQLDKYLHLMVYGEYIQSPQVKLAKLLADQLPEKLNCSYFVNSGSEAVDGAVKLAKRYTGKTDVVSFSNAYHGSTMGVLSLGGNENLKNAFRPLIPGIHVLAFNQPEQLEQLPVDKIACIVVEPIQGESGVKAADKSFLESLRKWCDANNTLLIFDEIQCGIGRSGTLFAFEDYQVVPDVLCLAKGMGGGMPIGAFISSQKIMHSLTHDPMLGHITTFGGHPVSCAAAIACIQTIIDENLIEQIGEKEKQFRKHLSHSAIREIRGKGLMLALQFADFQQNKAIIDQCIVNGLITDWFLFCDDAMRIAPPLTISREEIDEACTLLLKSIDQVMGTSS